MPVYPGAFRNHGAVNDLRRQLVGVPAFVIGFGSTSGKPPL
jgi:hypothetical protein